MVKRLQQTVRNKYFLSITLISFFIIVLFTSTVLATSFSMYKDDLKEKAIRITTERFRSYSNQINMQYNKLIYSADQLVSDPHVMRWASVEDTNGDLYLTKTVLEKLKYVSVLNEAVHSLEVYNAKSDSIVSHQYGYFSTRNHSPMIEERKSLYKSFMDNQNIKQLFLSSEEINSHSEPTIIHMNSVPMYKKNGVIGMVVQAEKLMPQNIASNENLFLVQNQDPANYISSRADTLIPEDQIETWIQTLTQEEMHNGIHEITIEGTLYYSAYQSILNNQLWLLMLVPESEIVENMTEFSGYFVIALGLIVILSILCSILIYRIAHQPIKKMVESVSKRMGSPKSNFSQGNTIQYLDQTFDRIISEQEQFFRDNALRSLIYGNYDEETVTFYKKQFTDHNNRCFLIFVFHYDRNQDDHVFDRLESLLFAELNQDYECHWLRTGYRQFTLLVHLHGEEERKRLLARVHQHQQNIYQKYQTTMTVGVSSTRERIQDLPECFTEAQEAVKNKALLGRNRMIDSMQLQHKRTQSFPIQEVQTLIRKLRVANEVDIIQALNKLIDEKKEHYSVELLHAFILYISSCIAQVGMEYNIHPDEMIDHHLFKVIVENDTIDEMKAYLHQQCKMIMAVRDSEQRKFKKLSAEAAIKYIEANFKKPISLESVSSEINMSASYLSRLIKQELGINFNTYLHKLRIEESLKLLKNEDMTIKEISNAVGYLSEHTFIRNFKSLMGKTPNHYRNSNLI